jgi:nucleoid DNA-binding protein
MTKRDFVVKIASETALPQMQVTDIVQKMLDYLSDEISKGNGVELRNFGVFELTVRKARPGRNPNKPEDEVIIPERVVVKFRPGKELKSRVEQIKITKIKKKTKK